jgi:hypothetical protein
MIIRWEYGCADRASVSYYVDDEPVGDDETDFDRVLELVSASEEPVTLCVRELSLRGDLTDELPFARRVGELRQRLGERSLLYELG